MTTTPTPHPTGKSIRSGIRPIVTVLAWGLVGFVALEFFDAIKFLLLGLLAASALAAMLSPLAAKIPGPRAVSGTVVGVGALAITIGIVAAAGYLLANPIHKEYQNWPQSRDALNQHIDQYSQRFNIPNPPHIDELAKNLLQKASSSGPRIISGTASGLADLAVTVLFVFVGAMYLLSEPPGALTKPALKILSPRHRIAMRDALHDLEPKLRGWALGTLVGMTAVGLAAGIGYRLVGLNLAIPLALLTAISEIVPTVGPFTAFCVALIFAAVQGHGQVLGVVVVYAAVQSLESYVLVPLVMQRAVRIPPIVTLFTVIIWGKIFGIAGLVMAVPIDLTIWSMIDHFIIKPREKNKSNGAPADLPLPTIG